MLLYGYIDKKNNKHMMTRPYICSSNYLKKMSNYKDSDGVDVVAIINGGKGGKGDGDERDKEGKGDKRDGGSKEGTWGIIMDALYYNLINTYMDDGFDSIYSVASSVKTWKKFPNNKKKDVLSVASLYIKWLWS